MPITPKIAIPSSITPSGASPKRVKFGKSPLFDWTTGEFVAGTTGVVATAADLEALKQWIYKALLTPRGSYVLYNLKFGHDILQIVRMSLPEPIKFSEIQRLITEAIIYDSRVTAVTNFKIDDSTGDELAVSFTVVAARLGQLNLSLKVGV